MDTNVIPSTDLHLRSHAPVSLRVLWLTMAAVFVAWTVLFILLQIWEHKGSHEKYLDMVHLKTEMLYHNAQALRRWIGEHGGVYVAVAKDVQPNPLLADIAERDVLTPSGQQLTLYNSPAFLRQVMDEFEADSGSRIRLVSENPINPDNVPDAWERAGLAHLAPETDRLTEMTEMDGRPFFRLLSPIVLREPCLRCHEYDESKVGGLIGAVSVALDAGPDLKIHERAERVLMLSHSGMWLLGTLGLTFGGWRWRQLLLSLEQSAVTDPLTGLYNRGELMRRLCSEISAAKRHGTDLSLIMLDIDHFKRVNDTYGHQAGDDVLQGMTRIMHEKMRLSDILARYGGEEFIIVCPHTNLDGATDLAERIRRSLEETPLPSRAGKLSITISAGISSYAPHMAMADFVKKADQALYEAKNTGRNRVCRSQTMPEHTD